MIGVFDRNKLNANDNSNVPVCFSCIKISSIPFFLKDFREKGAFISIYVNSVNPNNIR